jgi:LEA14-like dessication related protein
MSTAAIRLLLVSLLLGGCVERFLDFRVRQLAGVHVVGIDGTGFNLRVKCEIENPNALGAQLSGVQFRTSLGSHLLGSGQLRETLEVAARSRFMLEVPVRVAYADLPSDLPSRAASGELELHTEASFSAKTPVGTYAMRLVSQGRTRIAEALQVAVQGPFQGDAVRVESVSLAGLQLRRTRLRVRLAAHNLFAFPIRIQRGTFTVHINDTRFGTSSLAGPLLLPPRSRVSTEMEIAATHGTVATVVASMLGREPQFRVQGTLWIDPIGGVSRIPLDVRADSSVFGPLGN